MKSETGVYHQAAQLTPEMNFRRFQNDMLETLTPLVQASTASEIQRAQNWYTLTLALGPAASEIGSLVVVLDDYPFLSRSDPTLETVLYDALERVKALDQPLTLVLCGSANSHTETLFQDGSPLHGSSNLNLELLPFNYLEGAEFTPAWMPEQLVHVCTLFGGKPRYLAMLQDQVSVGENYERLVLDPNGPLHNEPTRILGADLYEPRVYASLLSAISNGSARASQAIAASGIPASNYQKYISRLEELDLVGRALSADAAPGTRNLRYRVTDPFIVSWNRYVLPHLSELRAHGGQGAWQKIVAPVLDRDLNAAPAMFEDICRQWTAQHMEEFWKGEFGEVGQIFQGSGAPNAEIDVACRLGSGAQTSWLLGECKWNENAQGGDVLRRLQDSAQKVIGPVPVQQWLLFNRGGFRPDLTTQVPERTRLVSLPELYGRQ
ncbi:archaeal ATPase, fused to C-terminal DUF234 domain [Deinococcus marmoris]|uniref:Archaeal ATPase, fused to C-terminal DUF234 domain n=1 Tax=Deinococcus marmoris TaxID=249408 RepID=A0A1U7NUT5_9DEIO|nr:archaeal ATPase, fused to C-terminal DUF234 domain [Deinococcus marmoris]